MELDVVFIVRQVLQKSVDMCFGFFMAVQLEAGLRVELMQLQFVYYLAGISVPYCFLSFKNWRSSSNRPTRNIVSALKTLYSFRCCLVKTVFPSSLLFFSLFFMISSVLSIASSAVSRSPFSVNWKIPRNLQ